MEGTEKLQLFGVYHRFNAMFTKKNVLFVKFFIANSIATGKVKTFSVASHILSLPLPIALMDIHLVFLLMKIKVVITENFLPFIIIMVVKLIFLERVLIRVQYV